MRDLFKLDFSNVRGDFFGGLTAGIVAQPLALAFGPDLGLWLWPLALAFGFGLWPLAFGFGL